MQEFQYKMLEDETFAVTGYSGEEKEVWPYAFVRCGIEEIILPEKIHSIAPFTFKDCRNLKKIIAGPSLKNVYGYAFGGCDSLTEFFFTPGTKLSPMAFESKGRENGSAYSYKLYEK